MEKFKVSFEANNQQLTKVDGIKHASDTYADIEATFVLGNRWTDMDSVSAVWWNDFTRVATVLDSNGKCIVPHEVLTRKGCVRVNLVGSIVEGDELITRLTSYSAEAVQVNEKIKLTGNETSEITPSQFEQFVSVVISEVEKVTGMTAQAETLPAGSQATARYENGILYLGIPQGIQGERGETGADGADGNGIASVVYNADYSLTLIFDNGEQFTTPPIRGERGPAGADGRDGADGADGVTPNLSIGTVETLEPTQDAYVTRRGTDDNPIIDFGIPKGDTGARGLQGPTGVTGNGIASAVLNSDYTLTLTFTDGTSYTTPSIRGAQGEISAADLQSAIAPLQYSDYKNDVAIKSAYAGSLAIIGGNVQTAGKQGSMAFLNLAYRAYSDITFGTSEVLELPADLTPSANTILFATTNSGSGLVNCYIRAGSRAIVVGGSIQKGLELRILGFYAVNR